MIVIPDMPDDFWPEELVVHGRDGGTELGFALTKEFTSKGPEFVADVTKQMIHALRRALWLNKHVPQEDTPTIINKWGSSYVQ